MNYEMKWMKHEAKPANWTNETNTKSSCSVTVFVGVVPLVVLTIIVKLNLFTSGLQFNMRRRNRSVLWNFFKYVDSDTAECNYCFKFIRKTGGSTTALKSHLRVHHKSVYNDVQALQETRKPPRVIISSVSYPSFHWKIIAKPPTWHLNQSGRQLK